MPKRFAFALALALCSLPPLASSASAATEVGNDCEANFATNVNVVGLAQATGGPLPLAAPSDGVVTRWRVKLFPTPETVSQVMKVFRPAGAPNRFQVVGESAPGAIGAAEGIPTRLPVRAGDRFGLLGTQNNTLVCKTENPADVLGAPEEGGAATLGSTVSLREEPGFQLPLVATIEPDADGDGYGDETQDRCPVSASTQVDCPPVRVTTGRPSVSRRAIVVQFRVSSRATARVFGQVSWKVRQPPGRRTAHARKGDRGLTVGLSAGPPRAVEPGAATRFRLALPKSVLRRLGRISPRQALHARITIQTTDLAGRVGERKLTVRLAGRAR